MIYDTGDASVKVTILRKFNVPFAAVVQLDSGMVVLIMLETHELSVVRLANDWSSAINVAELERIVV
jgi:hypothetical protein